VDDVEWRGCYSGWTEPLLPVGEGDFFSWPTLTDLFPWQHSGVQLKRTWPIAPDKTSLDQRWSALLSAPPAEQPALFRETDARGMRRCVDSLVDPDQELPPLIDEDPSDPPVVQRYSYRSFDRQFVISDNRVIDRPRPPLWSTLSARQLYLTSFLTGLLGEGPAATVTRLVPDLHHFRGSYGGKHVIPLVRDTAGSEFNITAGLLEALSTRIGLGVSPEDLLAYCYAVLQAPSYTERFHDQLEIPGPRIPLSSDSAIFERAVALGRELVWLHTYGERFVPPGHRAGRVPHGEARYAKPIPQRPDAFPERHSYDMERQELRVGEGVFAPVSNDVRSFSVSGLDVVGSWLDYRMKGGAGRRSSPLDEIRPTIWPESFTEELLELLWVLERTVALGPALDETLDAIVAGEVTAAHELPQPSDEERRPPG